MKNNDVALQLPRCAQWAKIRIERTRSGGCLVSCCSIGSWRVALSLSLSFTSPSRTYGEIYPRTLNKGKGEGRARNNRDTQQQQQQV